MDWKDTTVGDFSFGNPDGGGLCAVRDRRGMVALMNMDITEAECLGESLERARAEWASLAGDASAPEERLRYAALAATARRIGALLLRAQEGGCRHD